MDGGNPQAQACEPTHYRGVSCGGGQVWIYLSFGYSALGDVSGPATDAGTGPDGERQVLQSCETREEGGVGVGEKEE